MIRQGPLASDQYRATGGQEKQGAHRTSQTPPSHVRTDILVISHFLRDTGRILPSDTADIDTCRDLE